MAAGDVIVFDQFLLDVGKEVHDLSADTFKLGLTDGTTTPSSTTADPRWGAAGTTDFSAEEVTAGGNYAAGGPTVATTAYTLVSGSSKFDGDDVTISQNAGNPTDPRWAILYNDTAAGKNAVGAVDLGAVIDLSANDLVFGWGANGIFRLNQAAVSTADNVVNAGNNVVNAGDNVTNTA